MPDSADHSDPGGSLQWPLPQPLPAADAPLRLAVMASGTGSNFEALARACGDGRLHGQVVVLAVNRADCGARERAERLGIPCEVIDHRRQASREALDRALISLFEAHRVDLVVMAGWMRIVTPVLIGAYPERLVNIHPSLLPSFRGADGVGEALAAGVTLAGCTAHLVTEQVDAGPILVQAAVPVLADDDRDRLHARIQRQEHRILPLAVSLAARRLAQG
ncbi:phosphoribosylglycinamide formyltransferase [Cyanobium sp. N.Huapi 1H5]|uniref:phosphoribosylglycinamide formyltransferase n=1 Tax=Cyanobium sp. N.Huapi 1H5 TaxID=2823719 RepID=UPI0020CCCA88|nr:phosphoribosylglycinamide formyltransferase [Cyanobium sp. N.Huapi 1H5]MCP9836814.1 phosphoribosylglycinamide formyltransferase [Cyanobium sp. N.Huapi 1H5]